MTQINKTSDVTQKDVLDIMQILPVISRKKNILIISLIAFLLIAFIYNMISIPVYESFVIAKKEETSDRTANDEIVKMFSMQTADKLQTEIEIIKSEGVLRKVIDELKLTFFMREVEWHDDTDEEINGSYADYTNYLNSGAENSDKLPRFQDVKVEYSFPGCKYMILKSGRNKFEIYDTESDKKLPVRSDLNNVELTLSGLQLRFSWPNSASGDKFYIDIKSIEETSAKLKNSIKISAIGETNLAKLTVESESAGMAQLLANTIIEKYRIFRLDNKKQSVLSSFEFVNNQLEDIKSKLEVAEIELSTYKKENQIAVMDESSKDIIEFLSNLESEKIKVELELGDYRNKQSELAVELKEKGFFDQTHLTPQNGDAQGTPFSSLLKQLSDMEIKRLELSQRRTENHPEIISINEQIFQVKSKLAEYNQNTLTSYNIIISSFRKKIEDLNRLIARYSTKIENLPDKDLKLVQLTRTKNVYEKMFTLLLDKREEFRLAELSKMQDIVIIESAQISHNPVKPNKKLNIALALLLGSMVGLITIFVKEVFGKKITSLDDSEKISPYPLLSVIPKYDRKLLRKINSSEEYRNKLVTLMTDQNKYRESYRILDLKVRNFSPKGTKALIISSCEENTGKTSVTTNFAISLANKNKKVLLIDGDLRKASVADMLNETNRKAGLINYLTEEIDYSYIINRLVLDEKADKFLDYIIAGGTVENSSEILESDKMRILIEELSPQYDHILIDTPPLTRIIDTLVLGKIIHDMILVIKPDHTFRENVEMAIEELGHSEINVIGYIINACDIKKLSGKYKYGYGYVHGYPVNKTDNVII
jgi:capsular exopolysaccharide synthesis family protein